MAVFPELFESLLVVLFSLKSVKGRAKRTLGNDCHEALKINSFITFETPKND